jgi:hypothetical protein
MFANLSLKGFTWKREPALYVALAIAVLSVVGQVAAGETTWQLAVPVVVSLIGGFLVRGRVSPTIL